MHLTIKQRETIFMLGLLAATSLMTAACSSTPQPVTPHPDTAQNRDATEQRLRMAAKDWEGTPHRLGGLDRNGIDCSGLVVRIYADLFGYRMPRTTGTLARTGWPASRQTLIPGDLVLFHIPGSKQHLGIYLGREEFVHASASRGVMISRLDERYWYSTFWTARRILN